MSCVRAQTIAVICPYNERWTNRSSAWDPLLVCPPQRDLPCMLYREKMAILTWEEHLRERSAVSSKIQDKKKKIVYSLLSALAWPCNIASGNILSHRRRWEVRDLYREVSGHVIRSRDGHTTLAVKKRYAWSTCRLYGVLHRPTSSEHRSGIFIQMIGKYNLLTKYV